MPASAFNVINPFIAHGNLNYIEGNTKDDCLNVDMERFDELYEQGVFDFVLKSEEVPSKFNMKEAIAKREKVKEIYEMLPGLDCGSCGAPTCLAHAEDIYNKEKTLDDCVVLRANIEL